MASLGGSSGALMPRSKKGRGCRTEWHLSREKDKEMARISTLEAPESRAVLVKSKFDLVGLWRDVVFYSVSPVNRRAAKPIVSQIIRIERVVGVPRISRAFGWAWCILLL